MAQRGVVRDVDRCVERDSAVGHVPLFDVLNHDAGETGGNGLWRDTAEVEVPVGVGERRTNLPVGRAGDAGHVAHLADGDKVGDQRLVGDRRGVLSVTQLAADVEPRLAVALPAERREGLIDDLQRLGVGARFDGHPTEVGVAVGGILLEVDFGPRGPVVVGHRVSVARPGAASKARHGAGRKTGQASHGHERGGEFLAGAFVGHFQEVNRQILVAGQA